LEHTAQQRPHFLIPFTYNLKHLVPLAQNVFELSPRGIS
ncbi:unnamed protein product, partial [Amoebophrya sp. A25]